MTTHLRRQGRITRSQARALEAWASERVIPEATAGPVDWAARFSRAAPLGVEIGFGMGHALLDWAEAEPDMNLVGIDVYRPGIGALLAGCAERGCEHLLVVEGDARVVIDTLFAPASIREVRIFFPDPWPKKRHHKRRLVSSAFVRLLASRMLPGGRLRLATDWEDYAGWMLDVLDAEDAFANEYGAGFAERFAGRDVTRFEARGQRLGHRVWDLSYLRTG
ncbi:MAG: tRNA (guanosine(46)-N7)-methyltransferase TrmB [Pseudomonadales bacterium]